MQDMLLGLNIDIVGMDHAVPLPIDIEETGNNPLENARIKALSYFNYLHSPVFSCDSALYIEGLGAQEQPGVHIRRVEGKELTDEQMISHYSRLVARLGGRVKARYRNAICLAIDSHTILEYDGDDIASEEFFIVSIPHLKRVEGFPLDSLSIHCETQKYYFDLAEDYQVGKHSLVQANGFRRFFQNAIMAHG